MAGNPVTILAKTDQVKVLTGMTPAGRLAVAGQGVRGPAGPDPWDELVQEITAAGAVEVDYRLGKHVLLELTGDVTLTVAHWPDVSDRKRIARLTLEITNAGAHQLTLPGVSWQDGIVPTLTPNGVDEIILTTATGGARVLGHVAGSNFQEAI